MQRHQNIAVGKRRAAAVIEHGQLVAAIHATDGITMEQAELQVTAFEKHFKDDPQ